MIVVHHIRYDSAITESIIAMILIDILDAIVRYTKDRGPWKNSNRIKVSIKY